MAVFRVERTRDYTVMSNYHLKDTKNQILMDQILIHSFLLRLRRQRRTDRRK